MTKSNNEHIKQFAKIFVDELGKTDLLPVPGSTAYFINKRKSYREVKGQDPKWENTNTPFKFEEKLTLELQTLLKPRFTDEVWPSIETQLNNFATGRSGLFAQRDITDHFIELLENNLQAVPFPTVLVAQEGFTARIKRFSTSFVERTSSSQEAVSQEDFSARVRRFSTSFKALTTKER